MEVIIIYPLYSMNIAQDLWPLWVRSFFTFLQRRYASNEVVQHDQTLYTTCIVNKKTYVSTQSLIYLSIYTYI